MNIAGRSALVSGGASGLGAATVRMLVKKGSRVMIADLNEQAGRALVQELGEAAGFVKMDVTNEKDVQNAVDETVKRHGGLHFAVSTAGIGIAEKLIGKNGIHDLERFIRVLRVNLIGTFDVLRRSAQAMTANQPDEDGHRGVMVTTASIAAFDGQIGQVAYSASKGGVVAMTLPLARELARYGIRIVTIAPGVFHTPLLAGLPEAALQSLSQQAPFPPRLGRPEEYASLVQHIIENNMLNGETIRIDAAMRMAAK
jgi:NAD(P)-dependent dehydrogenase (short-subunit alcohol dehydrogenase family)